MALKVVGAGFGRTGTLSLKTALERLGFGPCYHMVEVFPRPEHVKMWHRLAFENSMDWDLLFGGFQATVDWPSARWWREIAEHYPQAKVLLSVRDPEAWYKSMIETIYQPMKSPVPDDAPEIIRLQTGMVRKSILGETFDNRFEDKAHALEVFKRHNQEVRDAIDPARLLGLPRPALASSSSVSSASTSSNSSTAPSRMAPGSASPLRRRWQLAAAAPPIGSSRSCAGCCDCAPPSASEA